MSEREPEKPPTPDGSREGVAIAMIVALVGLLVASPFSGWIAWAIVGVTLALALWTARSVQKSMQKRQAQKASAHEERQ